MRWTNASLMAVICLCLTFAPGTWSMAVAQTPGAAAAQTPEQLDKLTAPIALYPDALILQIVQCAASPYQVKQVDAWVKSHPDLKGSALQDGASDQGFDASFVAIVLFPHVLDMMAKQPEWTASLGQAFGSNRDAVFASIQRLRAQAKSVGNLTSNEQQKVETVATSSGQQVIVIQPANPQVVYVPQYDPQVVYVQTAPPPAPSNSGQVVAAGLIGFAAGVIVGVAADDDDDHYYYACGGWGYRGPALCSEGWNDYYRHRENMANDYYQHRENMLAQRGENQSGRQDNRNENQGNRQDNRTENQGGRQDNRTENQGGRQDNRAQNQTGRQDARAESQAGRGGMAAQGQEARQSSRGDGRTGQKATDRSPKSTGEQKGSGAFSGYQRGETERQSSSRGRQSTSRSSGSSRGSSGGASRSGGRSGGGRR